MVLRYEPYLDQQALVLEVFNWWQDWYWKLIMSIALHNSLAHGMIRLCGRHA